MKKPDGVPWRNEVNPHEYLHILYNFFPHGAIVMDDTAGSGNAAVYSALRLGLRCILIEKDKNGLFPAANTQWQQCYRFMKDMNLLCSLGARPMRPLLWEALGKAWQSLAQRNKEVRTSLRCLPQCLLYRPLCFVCRRIKKKGWTSPR